MANFNIGFLRAVKVSIHDSLTEAEKKAKSLAEGRSVATAFDGAGDVHKAVGALRMIGLEGCTLVCTDLERLARSTQEGKTDVVISAGAMLEALAAIKRYIEDLLDGAKDIPARLYSQHRKVKIALGEESKVSALDLFFPNAEAEVPGVEFTAQAAERVERLVKAERPKFQASLVKWMKEPSNPQVVAEAIGQMQTVCDTLAGIKNKKAYYLFWTSAAAFLELVPKAQGAAQVADMRGVISKIDIEMRKFAEGMKKPADEALRGVLFHIAQSDVKSERQETVRKLFSLKEYWAEVQKGLRESEAGAHLVNADEIKEVLAQAKDELLKLSAGSGASAKYQQLCASLATKIAAFQNPAVKKLSDAILFVAQKLASKELRLTDLIAEEVAFIFVLLDGLVDKRGRTTPEFDKQVDHEIKRLSAALKNQPELLAKLTSPDLDEQTKRDNERALIRHTVSEIKVDLTSIEETLDTYFRSEGDNEEELVTIGDPMKRAFGAIRILGLTDATRIMAELNRIVVDLIAGKAPNEKEMQMLTDGIGGISLYLEAFQDEADDAQALLTPLLALFFNEIAPVAPISPEDMVVEDSAIEEPAKEVAVAPIAVMEPVVEVARAPAVEFVAPPVAAIEEPAPVMMAPVSYEQPVPVVAETPVAAPAKAPAAASVGAWDAPSDDELAEVYLEETQEIFETIANTITICESKPHDKEALTTIRRAFHTLKGSGRMVGLTVLGEAAWQVEHFLNKWIADERPADADLLTMVELATAEFTAWVQELRESGKVYVDDAKIRSMLDELAHGKTIVAEAAPVEGFAEDAHEPMGDASAVASGLDDMLDPVEEHSAQMDEPIHEVPHHIEEPALIEPISFAEPEARVEEEGSLEPLAVEPSFVDAPEFQDFAESDMSEPVAFDREEASVPSHEHAAPDAVEMEHLHAHSHDEVERAEHSDAVEHIDTPVVAEHAEHSDAVEHAEHADAVEHAEHADAVEHDEPAAVVDHTEPAAVVEHAEHSDAVEHAEHSDAVEHAEHSDVVEHAEHSDVVERAEHSDAVEHAEHSDVVEHAEHTDAVERAEHSDVVEHAEHADVVEHAEPEAEVIETSASVIDASVVRVGEHVQIAPGLFEIFCTESEERMKSLWEEVSGLERSGGGQPREAMMRAAHTLGSIGRTIGFDQIANLGHQLEKWVQDRSDHRASIDASDLPMLRATAERLQEMIDAVRTFQEPEHADKEVQALADALAAAQEARGTKTVVASSEEAQEVWAKALFSAAAEVGAIREHLGSLEEILKALASDVGQGGIDLLKKKIGEFDLTGDEDPLAAIAHLISRHIEQAYQSLCSVRNLVFPEAAETAVLTAQGEWDKALGLDETSANLIEAESVEAIEVAPMGSENGQAGVVSLDEGLDHAIESEHEADLSESDAPVWDAPAAEAAADIATPVPGEPEVPARSEELQDAPAWAEEVVLEQSSIEPEPAQDTPAQETPAEAPIEATMDLGESLGLELDFGSDLGLEIDPSLNASNDIEQAAETETGAADQSQADRLAEMAAQMAEAAAAKDSDDLDESLLPVFAEEAVELLPQLSNLIRQLKASPSDAAAIASLHRGMHTLKGSARMVGAMRVGNIVHQLESMMEAAEHGKLDPVEFVDMLESNFDVVSSLVDRILNPNTAAPELKIQLPGQAREEGGAEMSKPGAVVADQRGGAERAAEQRFVRVGTETIDRLVNEAGEVRLSGAALAGGLGTMRRSLGDLGENAKRLSKMLRELELQTEGQMAARSAAISDESDAFDPLEFDRFTRAQELSRFLAEGMHDIMDVQSNMDKLVQEQESVIIHQDQMSSDIQQTLMSVRLVQFDTVADRLFKVIRQTAKEVNKKISLDIVGETVEIDRGVLDRMVAPLEHILRNAVAHGIELPQERREVGKPESGKVTVSVIHEGNFVHLRISDDGRGLNLDVVRRKGIEKGFIRAEDKLSEDRLIELIFLPGFSTAESVTQISGRGVGMDVVKNEIVSLGGQIDIKSVAGKGMLFSISLPVSLATTQAVLVEASGQLWAIPTDMIEEIVSVKLDKLDALFVSQKIKGSAGLDFPFHYLPRLLGEQQAAPEKKTYNSIILTRSGERQVAILVDRLLGTREIVVKNIGRQMARISGISGATVLGDGRLGIIINPVYLSSRRRLGALGEQLDGLNVVPIEVARASRPTIMVVDDSLTIRKATSKLLERSGYDVMVAKDGIDALEKLQDRLPDVILSDVEMPRMDGFELLKNLKTDGKYKNIPVVMITSRIAEKHRETGMSLGANVYLGKPYKEDELLGHIKDFLEQKVLA